MVCVNRPLKVVQGMYDLGTITWGSDGTEHRGLIMKNSSKGSDGLGSALSCLDVGKCKWQAPVTVSLVQLSGITHMFNLCKSNSLD